MFSRIPLLLNLAGLLLASGQAAGHLSPARNAPHPAANGNLKDPSSIREVAAFQLPDSGAKGEPQPSPEAETAQNPAKMSETGYRLEKLRQWREAAGQHLPGKPDAAAVKIGRWPIADLQPALDYISKLAKQSNSTIRRTLSRPQMRRLFDVTDQEAQTGDLTRVLKQGLLLHTDIALLELEFIVDARGRDQAAAFVDGQVVIQPKKLHWQFARTLLDTLAPISSLHPAAKQWYIATTAHMQSRRLLGYADENLERALVRFPADDRLLFYAGALHETWAAPINQNAMLPPGARNTYGSRESELKLARQYFQKAVQSNPAFEEAHLRLGRTQGLLGQHSQAVVELQRAAAAIKDPQLSYYAALYLGFEYETLLRKSEARVQYERAAQLYPTAQSPLLALSQLARSENDTQGALQAVQRVFGLPRKDLWKDDPWWTYDVAHARDAAVLVEQMYKMWGGLSE